jgi:cytoskeletal protein CcmA (bactofilin family)
MSSHSTIRRSMEDRVVLCVDCDNSRTLSLSASGSLVCSTCGSDNWMHLPMTAIIKETIFIKGDLVVQEDLTVEGCVEGKVEMNHHNLCIGVHGKAEAEIHAKNVIIAGHVTGSIFASELVEIRQTGSVHGNIQCPRISIVDGAKFTGRLDTEKTTDATLGQGSPKTQTAKIGHGTS